MNRIIICTILSIAFAFSAQAETSYKLPKGISKKWKLDLYIMYQVKYRPSIREKKDMLELNHADSSFARINEGKRIKGKWNYDKKKKELYLMPSDRKTITYKIIKKGRNKLVYTTSETNHTVVIYLIPFDKVSKYVKKAAKKKKKKAKATAKKKKQT